jgi:hypothetical protein
MGMPSRNTRKPRHGGLLNIGLDQLDIAPDALDSYRDRILLAAAATLVAHRAVPDGGMCTMRISSAYPLGPA